MKKIFLPIFVIAFGLCGALSSAPASNTSKAADLPQTVEIGDEATFYNLIKNTSEENASKGINEKQKLNIKLVDNLDFSEFPNLIFQDFSFYGVLDGNGFAISNAKISSSGTNYGLFAAADDAKVSYLRIDGTATYTFSAADNANVGLLFGSASNVTVNCCEFDVDFQTQGDESVTSGIVSDSKMNFGVVAGNLESGTIVDCINYSDLSFSSSKGQFNVGGFVGLLNMGKINNAINYGSIAQTNPAAQSTTGTLGGIVGHLAGRADIQNCAFAGNISNNALSVMGSLIGALSSLDDFANNGSKFAYCYFTSSASAIGQTSGMAIPSTFTFAESLSNEFFEDNANWSRGIVSFEASKNYVALDRMHLQVFQSFDFRVSELIDSAVTFVKIEAGGESTVEHELEVKYGSEVKIFVKYENPNFYSTPSASKIGGSIAQGSTSIAADPQTKGQYIFSINKSSYQTQGTYTFASDAIKFTCVVESADEAQGSVKWGATNERELTFKQRVAQITAEGKGSYDFDHWELYLSSAVEDGKVVSWSQTPDEDFAKSDFVWQKNIATTNSTQGGANDRFEFGTTAPFTTHFKLVAYFSQDNAVRFSVKFDEYVTNVTVDGSDFTGDDILLSPYATTEILVTVKKGYALDVEKLLQDVKVLYGQNSTSTVYTDDPLENSGSKTYKIRLNLQSINIENKTLSIRFSTVRSESNSDKSMLWLWILIPCVVVLIAGTVLAIFLIRRHRMYGQFASKNGSNKDRSAPKQKQSKKSDYKDYYY